MMFDDNPKNAIALERWGFRYPAFIWFASLLHLTWGIILISCNRQIHCVPLNSLYSLIPNPVFLGLALIGIGLLALYPAPKDADSAAFKIVTLIPQQVFTLMSGGGAVYAIGAGQYADGVTRPRSFILADQLPTLLAVVFHTIAFVTFIYFAIQGST